MRFLSDSKFFVSYLGSSVLVSFERFEIWLILDCLNKKVNLIFARYAFVYKF